MMVYFRWEREREDDSIQGGRELGRWNYEACGSLFFFEIVLRAFGMVLGGSRGLLCRLVMGYS